MNQPITLPQSVIKRLEKLSHNTRRTPEAIVREVVKNQLAYEELYAKRVAEGDADAKAGREFGEDEFWAQLGKARDERKKAA